MYYANGSVVQTLLGNLGDMERPTYLNLNRLVPNLGEVRACDLGGDSRRNNEQLSVAEITSACFELA